MTALGLAFVVVAAAAPAPAQLDLARASFQGGASSFRAARYDDAARQLVAAFGFDPDPAIAFDAGEALRRAGKPAEAVHYYRLYLAARPDAEDAGVVRGVVAALERASPPADARAVAPAAASAAKTVWPAYAGAALTAGIFAAAGIFGALAQQSSATLLGSQHPTSEATSLYRSTKSDAAIANDLYAVGGIAAAATGALILWEFR